MSQSCGTKEIEIKAGTVLPEIEMNQYSLFFDLMLISVLAGGGGGAEEKEVFLKRSKLTPSFLLLPSPPGKHTYKHPVHDEYNSIGVRYSISFVPHDWLTEL